MCVRVRLSVGDRVRVVGESVTTYLLRGILLLKSPGLMAADKPFLKSTELKNLYCFKRKPNLYGSSVCHFVKFDKNLQTVKVLNKKIAKILFFGT